MADDAEREIGNSKELAKVLNRDWAALPTELLRSILLHLFVGDVKSFHKVCRSWRSTRIQSPVLMHSGYDNTRCKFLHPLFKDSYCMYIPELFGAIPRFSKDGWLLMSRGKHSIFFFNPFTKALINLPDLPQVYVFQGITFTSSPTSPDCMVFGIHVHFDKYFSISTICRGEASWQELCGNNNSPIFLSHCNPVFHKGEFYCLGQQENLGVFNPKKASWRVLDNPPRQSLDPFVSQERNFLMECLGELLSVSISSMGKLISVSKLDGVEMTWDKVDNLGDQMLFVSNTSCLSVKKGVQGTENKIYLPRINGKCGVFYSLASGLFQTFGNDFSHKDLCGTGELVNCCWIVPKADIFFSKEKLNWIKDT